MPAADANAIHSQIKGAAPDGQGGTYSSPLWRSKQSLKSLSTAGFTVPCTTTASVAFTFGGTAFAMSPKQLAFLPVSNDLQGDCISGIAAGNIGAATQWLIGGGPFNFLDLVVSLSIDARRLV